MTAEQERAARFAEDVRRGAGPFTTYDLADAWEAGYEAAKTEQRGYGSCPPEPPEGTWVRDRYGSVSYRSLGGGWGSPNTMPFGVWEAMWEARGPLVECGQYGADL